MATYARSLTAPAAADIELQPRPRGRSLLVAVMLAAAAATSAGVLLFRPWPVRNSFLYSELAPLRDAIWTAVFIDAVAFATISIALALAVAMLTRTRGARLATVGGVMTMLGGVLFAMGMFAFGAFTWHVTDSSVVPVDVGTRALEAVVASPEHLLLPQLLGFLLVTLGSILLFIALLRSRAVPRWLPIAMLVGVVAQFGFHDRTLDFVQIGTMGLLGVLAAFLARSDPAGSTPDQSR
jgi:hypothetical protein